MVPPVMIPAIIIAVSIPLLFLYFIHRLDLYGTERPKLLVLAFGWGALATAGAYLINHSLWEFTQILPQPVVTRLTAPITEEFLKSLILIYLVRRKDFTYVVDGAIYGFTVGTGFAVIENVSYLYRVPESATLAIAVIRVFSAALLHGTASGIVGTTLGRLRFREGRSRTLSFILGLGAAIALHLTYNNTVTAEGLGGMAIVLGIAIGLSGVVLTAAFITAGMREEKRWLRETLGLESSVSEEEASLIQHMGDLDVLLAPVTRLFGKQKRDKAAKFLHLEAQLGLKREVEEKTVDPKLRGELHDQVLAMEQELDTTRREVGLYVMSYIRSILPSTKWSIWARIGQAVETQQISTEPSLWLRINARLAKSTGSNAGEGLYEGLQSVLDRRTQAATAMPSHVEELPEELRRCMHWVIKEKEVTLHHVVQGLRHEDEVAHSMLSYLTERGFLHRTMVSGETRYRARVGANEEHPALNLWQAARQKIQKSSE